MIEAKNKLYTQRFLASKLCFSDLWKAVNYTQLELLGGGRIPFWYKVSYGHTATTDLTLPWEEIYSRMKSNTRNETKRAEKEGVVMECNYDYDAFVPFYNDFCDSKGIPYKIKSVNTLKKYDKMLITVAKKDNQILCMHATVVNPKDGEAMLFYSCSPRLADGVDRKLIGWANRFLHYKELQMFKEQGFKRYEWHSLVVDPEDSRYSIGQFKLSFGGDLHETINLQTPLFVIMKYIQALLKKVR